MLKKVVLSLSLLGLTTSSFAAHVAEEMLPVAPPTVPVTIPQQAGSWALGLEALYMSAANGDFNYATTQTIQTGIPAANINSFDFRTHSADAEFEWGMQIDLTYNFEGNGRYLKADYRRIHGSDTDTTNRVTMGNAFMSGPGILPAAGMLDVSDPFLINRLVPVVDADFPDGWDQARGKTENDYDHIDLVWGQRKDYGQKVTLAAFGGVRYTFIDIEDTANYTADEQNTSTPAADRATARLHLQNDIHLLGPRAGVDAQVRLGAGFSVVGTIAGSVLAGDLNKKLSITSRRILSNGIVSPSFNLVAKQDSSTRIVPEIDSRVGVNYTGSFTPDFAFSLEVGYDTTNYFDVKDHSLVSFVDTQGHDNDFGLYGLYLKAEFEVA